MSQDHSKRQESGVRRERRIVGFGLRLTLAGGREAAIRLAVIAAAVAIGVGMLLATLAGLNGVNSQNDRNSWLNSGTVADKGTVAGKDAADPLWWDLSGGYFQGRTVGRVEVAATGAQSPVPPGIPRLPGPGEYYASPELAKLIQETPADQLADRYPGHLIGTIGDEALPSPNSLIIVIGQTVDELSHRPGAVQVSSILTTSPGDCDGCFVGIPDAGLDLILAVVAGGLLFPVLMFIGTASRLSATRREQRFAAMRLVGATPRQISMISTVEATVSALAGTLAGFGLFFVFRNMLADIPFTGSPFFADDMSLGPIAIVGVALGVPVAAAIAARLALRRVQISPLGVTRRVTPKPPRAYRLIAVVLGVAELAYFVGRRPDTSDAQVRAFLPGFLIIMVGLVIAGPWLTMVGARLLARHANRPATLIAARRLADNPKAGFRSVSGLVLALFVTTAAVGVISTIVANRAQPVSDASAGNLIAIIDENETPAIPDLPNKVLVYSAPEDMRGPGAPNQPRPYSLASCAELAQTLAFGQCAVGAQVAWVYPDLLPYDQSVKTPPVWPAAAVTLEAMQKLPLLSIVVGTDGSSAAIERARTELDGVSQRFYPFTDAERRADMAATLNLWKQLANVVIVSSLVIAGCSLAVSVAGGLSDRKRPFSMLRLTGVPLGMLRRVITLESAAPLLGAAVVAIGAGLLAAHLFLKAQMEYSLGSPGLAYYVIVAAGLAASLGIIASTLPLLRRITGPETARNE